MRRILGLTVNVTSTSLIESRFVILDAERTKIVVAIEGLQGRGRLEHAAAARTEHVPGHVEEAEPRRMDERADHRLLVEPALGGEGERVDAVQRLVRSGFDGGFQRVGDVRMTRMALGGRRDDRIGLRRQKAEELVIAINRRALRATCAAPGRRFAA